jgi:hypothetical protein
MVPGPPSPLLRSDRLAAVLALAAPGQLIGIWLRECSPALRLRCACRSLLASSDLGFLLRHCNHIVVRHCNHLKAVEAHRLIAWRTLRIVTGETDLPGLDELRTLIPRFHASKSRIDVPLALGTPEEALAACVAARVPVVGSCITYCD